MKKIRPIIKIWFNRLIKQSVMGIIKSWLNRLIKQSVMGNKPEIIRDQLKDKIINNTWRPFDTENKEDRKRSKMKK